MLKYMHMCFVINHQNTLRGLDHFEHAFNINI